MIESRRGVEEEELMWRVHVFFSKWVEMSYGEDDL